MKHTTEENISPHGSKIIGKVYRDEFMETISQLIKRVRFILNKYIDERRAVINININIRNLIIIGEDKYKKMVIVKN